jgi:hypothetical protein
MAAPYRACAGSAAPAVLSGKFGDLSDYLDDPPNVDATKRPRSAGEFFRQLKQAFS